MPCANEAFRSLGCGDWRLETGDWRLRRLAWPSVPPLCGTWPERHSLQWRSPEHAPLMTRFVATAYAKNRKRLFSTTLKLTCHLLPQDFESPTLLGEISLSI